MEGERPLVPKAHLTRSAMKERFWLPKREGKKQKRRGKDVKRSTFGMEKRRERGASSDGSWWTRRRGRVLPALGCGYDSNSRHRGPAKTQTKSNTAILDNKVLIIDEQTLRQTDRREAKEGRDANCNNKIRSVQNGAY